jgi:hypothetical protein
MQIRACESDGVRPIVSHVADASGRLHELHARITDAFAPASDAARTLLAAEGIDVVFVDAPDETIPEWGVGGTTLGPHAIVVALDPGFDVVPATIEATLLHEFHHAMRWRGPGCGEDLARMLVSEGLAQLFEEEVLGVQPFYSECSITDEEIALAHEHLFDARCDRATWFFGANAVTRCFGYTYGYRLCRAFADQTDQLASDLVDVSASDVLASCGVPLDAGDRSRDLRQPATPPGQTGGLPGRSRGLRTRP